MVISIATLFPELYTPFLTTSLLGRAQEQKQVLFSVLNLFTYSSPKERIDAPTYGHGPGMLIRPEIIDSAVQDAESRHGPAYKIFFSPHGQQLDQDVLKEITTCVGNGHLMLLPARYEGMDARVEEYYADKVISLGNFVLMGGDIPAMMLIEGLVRLLPGVVGKAQSVENESFSGAFVDYPEYTAPQVWNTIAVPEVVRSGNHKELAQWREQQAIERSVFHHFDWVRTHDLTADQATRVLQTIPAHYAILMHSDVKVPNAGQGTTSVTSLDIHDIARSACTYGLKGYYLVTPFVDQQKIIHKLLDFWASDAGTRYNKQRQEALQKVTVTSTLEETIALIKAQEGQEPVLLGTSANAAEYNEHEHPITYHDHTLVWQARKPVAFVFGTGCGLASSLLARCTFMLPPLRGFCSFNHLSVRSAAAVVFDRWLGTLSKKVHPLDCKGLS